MLYTVLSDSRQYLGAVIDSDYVASIVGGLRGSRIDDRIDVNHQPRTWKGFFLTLFLSPSPCLAVMIKVKLYRI